MINAYQKENNPDNNREDCSDNTRVNIISDLPSRLVQESFFTRSKRPFGNPYGRPGLMLNLAQNPIMDK
jgi:hypothetical protein